jgi:hypothetical protein
MQLKNEGLKWGAEEFWGALLGGEAPQKTRSVKITSPQEQCLLFFVFI